MNEIQLPYEMGYDIVNAHLHLVRDVATEKISSPHPGWPDEWYWCNGDRISTYMNNNGISYVVSVNVMDTDRMIQGRLMRLPKGTPEADVKKARDELKPQMIDRVKAFNDWIIELSKKEPRVVPFVFIDPVLFGDKAIDELDRCLPMGAKGVKIHPNWSMHLPDHPNMSSVYDRCEKAGVWILTDSSGPVGAPDEMAPDGLTYGAPMHFAPVLEAHPNLKFIMAHFCETMWDDRLELARKFKDNLWFDMSPGWADEQHPANWRRAMTTDQAVRVFRKVGTDRMLFGTDGGSVPTLDYAGQILSAPFTEAEKIQILSGNAKRLLGLK